MTGRGLEASRVACATADTKRATMSIDITLLFTVNRLVY